MEYWNDGIMGKERIRKTEYRWLKAQGIEKNQRSEIRDQPPFHPP
jgi:hypothetical protein